VESPPPGAAGSPAGRPASSAFSLIGLATGITLGLTSRWGVLRFTWVAAKLCLALAIILMGALAIGPWLRELQDASGASAPGAEPELGSRAWYLVAGAGTNALLALAAVVLSVFKPGGRLRRERS
jgi:hypothetical protein